MSTPNEPKTNGDVSVQIERLILDGINLTPHEQSLFRTALETELARRFASEEIAAELRLEGTVPSLFSSIIHIRHGLPPSGLGKQVGSAVFGALKRLEAIS
jgi:hypothetical protein